MNILTFGSCLSRYTINQFLKMFPGQLLGSVFHNRSDAFLANYVDNQWQLPDYHQLIQSLDFVEESRDSAMQVIANQYPFAIGLHDLPKTRLPLMDMLPSTELDLIVLDNYMDIRPSLITPYSNSGQRIFFNSKYSHNFDHRFALAGELLTPAQSVANWYRILELLRKLQPNAFIVFLQFPYNLYNDSVRTRRCQSFEEKFNPGKVIKGCLNVPPMFIAPAFQHTDPQHYKTSQYSFYAGMIYQYLSANRSCSLFKDPSSVRFEEYLSSMDQPADQPAVIEPGLDDPDLDPGGASVFTDDSEPEELAVS